MLTDAISLEKITSRVELLENKIRTALRTHTIVINDLGISTMALSRPVWITVEQHADDDFVACFYDADIYGYGDNIASSLDDLKQQLVSQFQFLAEQAEETELAPVPREQFEVLKRLIVDGVTDA